MPTKRKVAEPQAKGHVVQSEGEDVPGGAPPKKARGAAMKRRADLAKKFTYSVIKCKIGTVCKSVAFQDKLQDVVSTMNAITREAYHIATADTLRRLDANLPPPVFNQVYFYQCLRAANEATSRFTCPRDMQLQITVREVVVRWRPEGWAPRDTKRTRCIRNEIAKEMATATRNHVALNYAQRLVRLARIMHGMSKYDAQRWIYATYDDARAPDAKMDAFRAAHSVKPYPDAVDRNFSVALCSLHAIQRTFEEMHANAEADLVGHDEGWDPDDDDQMRTDDERRERDTRRMLRIAKRFTLLPRRSTFVPCAIPLSTACVTEMLTGKDVDNADEIDGDDTPHAIWDGLFDFSKVSTGRRKFLRHRERIVTDGVSVCVCLNVPSVDGAPAHDDDDKGLASFYAREELQGFDRYVGIDPGVGMLVAGQVEVDADGDERAARFHCKTSEYRAMAGMTSHLAWVKKYRATHADYAKALEALPSFKTADLETFIASAIAWTACVPTLARHAEKRVFRNWNFRTYSGKQRALRRIVRRITADARSTCVGFGDWSAVDSPILKGNAKGPVKRLRAELERTARVRVVSIDEHRTSKTCSACGCECKKMRRYKQWRDGTVRLARVHGVVRCSNTECRITWGRDTNASRNILGALLCLREGIERPAHLCRRVRPT